jgi:hypothetical protein
MNSLPAPLDDLGGAVESSRPGLRPVLAPRVGHRTDGANLRRHSLLAHCESVAPVCAGQRDRWILNLLNTRKHTMNSTVSHASPALTNGKLFLNAMILAGLAAVLGLNMADANAATGDATSAASAATPPHKAERVVSDTWITTKVKSEILKSSVAKGFDVKVTTLHGVVTLKGSLASADAIDQVKAIAGKVKGVQSVDTATLAVAAK